MAVEILRYELLGQWTPFLTSSSTPIVNAPDSESWRIEPQSSRNALFMFNAAQAGVAKLSVAVKIHGLEAQPFDDIQRSEMLEISVSAP